jgi:Cu+-exporting ATPase
MIISALRKPIIVGILGIFALLAIYFTVVGLISDSQFAINQFNEFWYYIIALAIGFGVQLGLYTYLRQAIYSTEGSGKILAVSGGTSTAAMITCCAHYLVNIAPLIATAGIITFLTQYQVQFFWIGLAFNLGGIVYIASRVRKFTKHI